MKIKAKVYCDGTDYFTDEIDIACHIREQMVKDKKIELKRKLKEKSLKSIKLTKEDLGAVAESVKKIKEKIECYCIEENGSKHLNIFQKTHVVPDIWRYTVKVCNGDIQVLPIVKTIALSDFDDRPATDAIGTKIILLILESPHKSEYAENEPKNSENLKPKAPAQGKSSGDAGGGIKEYLHIVLRKINLLDGFYSLVISNPIPYMCSLGIFTNTLNETLRNNIWEAIWQIEDEKKFVIQDVFIARCAMYQPEYIINCCTCKLKSFVTNLLATEGFKNIYKTSHPAVTWNVKQENLLVELA
jgi:hypothetical protein